MTDIIFAGQRGSGKTLRVVKLTVDGHRQTGALVVSNIKFKKIPYTKFDINVIHEAISKDMDLNEIYGSDRIIMALDELTMLGDSHRSLTTEVNTLSYLFMQARKKGIDIIGTVQVYGRLDKTIRLMVETKVGCRRIGSVKKPRAFLYKYVKRFSGKKWARIWRVEDFSAYYDEYDTNQPINPQKINKK